MENKSLIIKGEGPLTFEEITDIILDFDCKIFNVEILAAIPQNTTFFRAELPNSIFGVNSMICEQGKQLRIVAHKGTSEHWILSAGPAEWDWSKVRDWGNKIHDENEIRRVLPCDDAVLKRYNH